MVAVRITYMRVQSFRAFSPTRLSAFLHFGYTHGDVWVISLGFARSVWRDHDVGGLVFNRLHRLFPSFAD